MKNLRQFLGLCEHGWEVIEKVAIYRDSDTTKLPIGTEYHLQCKNCGEIRKKYISS